MIVAVRDTTGVIAFSNANKGLIHASFSSNPNWIYDWVTFYRPLQLVAEITPFFDILSQHLTILVCKVGQYLDQRLC
jgi:hypothetical protein